MIQELLQKNMKEFWVDENIVKSAWLDTLHYLYLMGGIGTCKQIANKYGNGAAQL